MVINTPTLIVGAGPAGLAVAGRLRKADADFVIVEAADKVGSSWHTHYDRLHLHTVKELSHLPHVPFPRTYPRYVPRDAVADYLERYAHALDLRPRFRVRVTSIERVGDQWLTSTDGPDSFRSPRVVIATGASRVPHRPQFPGEELFGGTVRHSRDYRNPEPFAGHRVLVVGMGNTGAEIALDLCEAGVEVTVSVRGPVNIIPRDVLGLPTQVIGMAVARLPRQLGDRIGVLTRRLSIGQLTRFGIRTAAMAPSAELRELGRTPVMDIGTVARIRSGEIQIRPGIDHFTEDSVSFNDGTTEPFDDVILATGYRPWLADFVPDGDRLGVGRVPVVGAGPHAGLFFVGFDNHQPGGLLRTVFNESERVAAAIVHGAAQKWPYGLTFVHERGAFEEGSSAQRRAGRRGVTGRP